MTLRVSPADVVASSTSPLVSIAPWWKRVRLGDLVDVTNGAPYKSEQFNTDGRGLPVIRIRDVGKPKASTFYDGEYEDRHLVEHGDLLVGMDGDFRAARWAGPRSLLNQRVCRLRLRDQMAYSDGLLTHVVQPYLDEIHKVTSVVTVKHLSSKTIEDLPIPLPLRTEQERIVAAIEEHLSRLDAAEASVDAGKGRLDSLRLASLGPVADAPSQKIGDLLLASNYGTSAKCSYEASGPPVLRIPNIRERRVAMDDLKFARDSQRVGRSSFVADGDVLVVRTNGSRNLIGRTAMVRSPARNLAFASYLIRLSFDPLRVLPEYASMMLESPALRREIEGRAASSAGQYNLSLSKLNTLEIPVPDLADQKRLVAEFTAVERDAEVVRVSLDRAGRRGAALRRSILAAAFSGRLVAQDPSDEPADVLLARIADMRSTSGSKSKARARTLTPQKESSS